jgi:mono/diheme cytochrome c family protein
VLAPALVVAAVLTVAGLAMAVGTTDPPPRVVEAERFVLRDVNGQVRAELRLVEGQPSLELFDDGGKRRLRFGLDSDGSARVLLYDKNGAGPTVLTEGLAFAGQDATGPLAVSPPAPPAKALTPGAPVAGEPKPRKALPRAGMLFMKLCQSCHGADGRGKQKKSGREPPDFTNPTWHASRSDAALLVSILEGAGTGMPAFNDQVQPGEARELVSYVRAFNPASAKQPQKTPTDTDGQFQQLQRQYDELREQLRRITPAPGK